MELTIISEMGFDELVNNYQSFLEENLTGKEVTKIAVNMDKSPKTIYNYLNNNYTTDKPNNNLLLMRAIVENGLEILSQRGVNI